MEHRASGPGPASKLSRIAPQALILLTLALQTVAATRLLCPPRSIAALQPLRVACAPCLWPFTDYPMFSEPHYPGESLAWIEARFEISGRTLGAPLLYEVKKTSPDEPWSLAFEREEMRVRSELQRELASHRSADLVFERKHVVLTEGGFVPVRDDEGEWSSR
jgi:hypothetical protein